MKSESRVRVAGREWPSLITRGLLLVATISLPSGCINEFPQDSMRLVDLPGQEEITHSTKYLKPCFIGMTNPNEEGGYLIVTDGVVLDLTNSWIWSSSNRYTDRERIHVRTTTQTADDSRTPDQFTGRCIVVRGAKNVTIKNGNICGFKIAIYAEDAPGLTIENCDVSNNYRQHLKSTPRREDESDWLYGHENDKGEWLRYGAGIYLLRCNDATIKNCRARNGQNGICIVSSDRVTAVGNDMSFMSGWGLAMWRSNFCKVISNRFDYCVRGYSHGVYARGQDSTGILVYEQCSDNIFAYNQATHSGDGFFLYAGNETVQRTGEGGCNRNLVYMNDFSYAVANGVEATFSDQNAFIANKLNGCEHGVWAGYSTKSLLAGNEIHECTNGVSIEHGRGNTILGNSFERCGRGIALWWDDDKDLLASAYCQKQGGLSAGESVLSNIFMKCDLSISLQDSTDAELASNNDGDGKTSLLLNGHTTLRTSRDNVFNGAVENRTSTTILGGVQNWFRGSVVGNFSETLQPFPRLAPVWPHPSTFKKQRQIEPGEASSNYFLPRLDDALAKGVAAESEPWVKIRSLAAGLPVMKDSLPGRMGFPPVVPLRGIPEGKEYVVVDEWGPYDFKQSRVWPERVSGWSPLTAMILGPGGTAFKTERLADPNLEIIPSSGKTPVKIRIAVRAPPHTGPSRAAPFSTRVRIGNSNHDLRGTLLFTTWTTMFYEWTKATDPRESEENWKKILASKPFLGEHGGSLDYTWGGGGPKAVYEAAEKGEPRIVKDHFAVVANTTMNLPPGKWTLHTISDDGVRVFVNDRKVIDNWTWHVPTEDKGIFEVGSAARTNDQSRDPDQSRDRKGAVGARTDSPSNTATTIRVEYFEIDGHAQLQLFLEPASE